MDAATKRILRDYVRVAFRHALEQIQEVGFAAIAAGHADAIELAELIVAELEEMTQCARESERMVREVQSRRVQ